MLMLTPLRTAGRILAPVAAIDREKRMVDIGDGANALAAGDARSERRASPTARWAAISSVQIKRVIVEFSYTARALTLRAGAGGSVLKLRMITLLNSVRGSEQAFSLVTYVGYGRMHLKAHASNSTPSKSVFQMDE